MHYSYEVDVLTSYTEAVPLVQPLKLSAGILFNADFLFEVGDGYSSCVILWNRATQILPSNPDGWYSADGLLISAPCWYDLSQNDTELYLIAWNRGGMYDHTINVMLSVKAPNEPDVETAIKYQNDILSRQIDLMRSML